MCQQLVQGGLDGLRSHFINHHGLTVNRGVGNKGFVCGEVGCHRRFTQFYSLRKHHRRSHVDGQQGEPGQPQPIPINILDVNNNDFNDNNHDLEDNFQQMDVDDDPEEDNNAVDDEIQFDLKTFITRMIGRLQCNGSMTGSMITSILDEFEQLSFYMRDFLKRRVSKHLRDQQLLDNDGITELLTVFDFENPFDGIRTLDQQIDTLRDRCGYIDSEEIPLGYRMDSALDRETCTYVPKMVMETFQYVPIIKVLSLVWLNDTIREAILAEEKSPNGVLASFLDGEHCNAHPLFSRFPHALRLRLYYDELEIVNPLGSKTGIHKLGAFYYQIENLPGHMNSELSDIHVLVLCCDADVKKYGFRAILAPFLDDLLKLESDEGVIMRTREEEFVLRASISAFCGGGLAVHQVYNLLGPSANRFCRMCMYSREDLHAGSTEAAEERTEHLHQQHLALLEQTNFSAESLTETGVRGECPLNRSRYFHSSRNKIFDEFHDILNGVGPMVLKLTLKQLVLVQRKFDIEFFNGRISAFNYGYVEVKNKPSANFTEAMLRKKDHTLSQKGMQMWLLLRVFPFLVSEKVDADDDYVGLILHLLRIMELVFAPKITDSLIPYLRALVKDFFMVFQRLFPDVNSINKFHHLDHYADCILWSGPMALYNCVRFEGKHGEIKKRAQNVNNFKNPPKTLIRVSQCIQSSKWGAGDVKLIRFQAISGSKDLVHNTLSRDDLYGLDYIDADEVFRASSVRVNGTEYRVGLYVCLETAPTREDNLPLFGHIKEIIVLRETEVYLQISVRSSILFDPNLNAYCIEPDDDDSPRRFTRVDHLAHYKPFCCWSKPATDDLFISFRHVLI